VVGPTFRIAIAGFVDIAERTVVLLPLASTPLGMPGTHPHQYFGWWGRQWEYPHQYFYVLSDIADNSYHILVALCSIKQISFGHKIPHCRQFASVTQVDSGLTRLQQSVYW